MTDLTRTFADLMAAAAAGRFEEEVRRTPLAEAPPRLHPLNFVALRIADGRGTSLRLHFWDRRFQFGQAGFEVHDHSFDLDSYVVAGAVEQITFEARPDDEGDRAAFEVRYVGEGSALEARSGRMSLRVAERRLLRGGERYQLEHGRLHSLELASAAAMTLVLTEERGNAPISIGPYGTAEASTSREVLRRADGRTLVLAGSGFDEVVKAAVAVEQQAISVPPR